jgi:hypothetical protein
MRTSDSFRYLTRDSLPSTYFDQARQHRGEPNVYVVLSNTKSPASKAIAFFTGAPFNHVSIAFDPDLETLVSYNGGNNSGKPGLNRETLEELRRVPGSAHLVYAITVPEEQKEAMLERIAQINVEGSSYNLLGLVTNRSAKPNIMFCSQFVPSLLGDTGVTVPPRTSARVRPMDFAPHTNK